MDIFLLVLRLVHILAGVFWVGGALIMGFFIGPSIGATAQAGKQFAGHLMLRTRLVTAMTNAAILTVLAGGILYWRDSQGLTSMWMHAGSGIGYAIGGVAGLIGSIFGIAFGRFNRRMALIGAEIKAGNPRLNNLRYCRIFKKRSRWFPPFILAQSCLLCC